MREIKYRKFIVIKLSAFESEIIDEKNFAPNDISEIETFIKKYKGISNVVTLGYDMAMFI